MHLKRLKSIRIYLLLYTLSVMVSGQIVPGDNSAEPIFDSQLLRLKVPEAFQKSSLKLEIFADSSWQLYRGNQALSFQQALELLGQSDKIRNYEQHLEQIRVYEQDYRSRRVFAIVTGIGGAAYLSFIWSRGWVYQIPGYAALTVAGVRLWESHQYEGRMQRERYYLQSLMMPHELQKLVDDYNLKLYQFLSKTGIQFHGS